MYVCDRGGADHMDCDGGDDCMDKYKGNDEPRTEELFSDSKGYWRFFSYGQVK